jgi:hypothetical protein
MQNESPEEVGNGQPKSLEELKQHLEELKKHLDGLKTSSKTYRFWADLAEFLQMGSLAIVDVLLSAELALAAAGIIIPGAVLSSSMITSMLLLMASGVLTIFNGYKRLQQMKTKLTELDAKEEVTKAEIKLLESRLLFYELEKKVNPNFKVDPIEEAAIQWKIKNFNEKLTDISKERAYLKGERIRLWGKVLLSGGVETVGGAFSLAVTIASMAGAFAALPHLLGGLVIVANGAVLVGAVWGMGWNLYKWRKAVQTVNQHKEKLARLEIELGEENAKKLEYNPKLEAIKTEIAETRKALDGEKGAIHHANMRLKKVGTSSFVAVMSLAGLALGIVAMVGIAAFPPAVPALIIVSIAIFMGIQFYMYNKGHAKTIFNTLLKKDGPKVAPELNDSNRPSVTPEERDRSSMSSTMSEENKNAAEPSKPSLPTYRKIQLFSTVSALFSKKSTSNDSVSNNHFWNRTKATKKDDLTKQLLQQDGAHSDESNPGLKESGKDYRKRSKTT